MVSGLAAVGAWAKRCRMVTDGVRVLLVAGGRFIDADQQRVVEDANETHARECHSDEDDARRYDGGADRDSPVARIYPLRVPARLCNRPRFHL
jgi:hypothetical protein